MITAIAVTACIVLSICFAAYRGRKRYLTYKDHRRTLDAEGRRLRAQFNDEMRSAGEKPDSNNLRS